MKNEQGGISKVAIVAIIVIIIAIAAVGSYLVLKEEKITYTLSTSVSPSDGGSVSPTSGIYNEGESITLTATPVSGYQFDHWGGDVSGSVNPVTVTMSSNKSIIAYFNTLPTLSTSVSPSSGGSVSPESGTYEEGESVTLTATPASGYQFENWGGDANGSTNTITITMDSDKSIVAYFTAPPKPGNWTASTGISNFAFAFTVNPDSTGIIIVDYKFTDFTMGSIRTSGGASVKRTPPWPITDDQLTIDWTESMSNWDIVIQGSFDETGTHASGTWEISAEGTASQTGTWEASAP